MEEEIVKQTLELIREVRRTGDCRPLTDIIPYARFMGITADVSSGELIGKLAYSDMLIGNSSLPALHGGTLSALLESTAAFEVLWRAETIVLPKTINITVEYLRGARPQDVFAKAVFTRHGRRVANVRVFAYQDDPDEPVAVATAHFLLVQD